MYTDFMTYLQRGLHTENGSLGLSLPDKLRKSRNEMIGRMARGKSEAMRESHEKFNGHLQDFELCGGHLKLCGLCEVFAQNNRSTVHSDEWR